MELEKNNVVQDVALGVKKAKTFLKDTYSKPINVVLVDNRKLLKRLIGHSTELHFPKKTW